MKEKISYYGAIREIDGILHLEYYCDEINIEIAQKLVEDRIELSNHTVSYLFVDGTSVKSIDKKTRDFFGSEKGTYLVGGMAFFSNSRLSTFLANFLVKVNLVKYNFPIKLFNDKSEAISWLKTIKKQHE